MLSALGSGFPARHTERVEQLTDLSVDRQRRLAVELVALGLRKPLAELCLPRLYPFSGERVLPFGLGM
jgi:hypothetical protein